MKDISIEYAHIYTNNKIGKEHELSINILEKLRRELHKKGESFSLVILVDDYSFPDPTFDYDNFSSWLESIDFKPDLMMRESQLIPLCDKVIQKITNDKLREQLVDYVKAKKYPCSLFIAAWYLLRLGYFKHPSFSEGFYSKRMINILPESFKPFEEKALEILAATEFLGVDKKIEYYYIEGRLIA